MNETPETPMMERSETDGPASASSGLLCGVPPTGRAYVTVSMERIANNIARAERGMKRAQERENEPLRRYWKGVYDTWSLLATGEFTTPTGR